MLSIGAGWRQWPVSQRGTGSDGYMGWRRACIDSDSS
jgi:hypothetical protein